MIRQNREDGRALATGNFLLACLLLGGCFEAESDLAPIHTPEQKEKQSESDHDFENLQEVQPVEEIDVSKSKELEILANELIEKFLSRLKEEQWQITLLQLEDLTEIDVPSDDFNEPKIAHAVLNNHEHLMNYAWLEINGMNSKFNKVWQKHWAAPIADGKSMDMASLIVHMENIQRKYESLLIQIREVEFKSTTEHAQHLHDYKLYLEGAILYRMEAAAILLQALETGERLDARVAEAVKAAIESEAYAQMCNTELLRYQQDFQIDSNSNIQ